MSMTTETPAKAKRERPKMDPDVADDGDYKYEAFDTEAKDDSAEEKEKSAP